MRSRLLLKLMGAFFLVIVIGALVIYVLTIQATLNAFRVYTTQNSQLQAQRLAPEFAAFYAQNNTWQGVASFLQVIEPPDEVSGMMNGMGAGRGQGRGMGYSWMSGMGQRLILADAQGEVVADTEGTLTGSQLSAQEAGSGAAVILNGTQVGTLIVAPGEQHSGSDPSATFLANVNRSLLISVLVAGALSLVMVLLFSIQITAPVRQMQQAAGAIARGDLRQRVLVRSHDELGELALSFNEMAGALAEAENQRRKLIADVAHELRTPLAVIRAHAEGMQDGVLPVDLDQVNAIHAETLLLGRLIDDLRLLSLAEAGELRLDRQPADFAMLLQTAADRFQPQCVAKGVTLMITVGPDLPLVMIDNDRIQQVTSNLVANSIRYTPPGGAISLVAIHDPQNSNQVRISVTDNGPGIASEDLPWIFDRFYRAEKSRARLSGGSGLGLAIARQLVEAHGGRIWATSPVINEPGKENGTQINFTLPVEDSTP